MLHIIHLSSTFKAGLPLRRHILLSKFRSVYTASTTIKEEAINRRRTGLRQNSTVKHSDTFRTNIIGQKQQQYQRKSSKNYEIFASTLPGFEPILSNELETKLDIVKKDQRLTNGGISFNISSVKELYECHLHLGTASHLLLRATSANNGAMNGEKNATFHAVHKKQIVQKVRQMDIWKDLIPTTNPKKVPKLEIRVTASKSKLFHTTMVAECVRKGIYKALNIGMINDNRPDTGSRINILVRIHRDQVEISIDTSLTPLHRRGYKLDVGKAPLREDIAFGFLHALGWSHNKKSPLCLIDPFCGSGTIVIEGANMVLGFPPGRLRPPPCEHTSLYDEKLWNTLVESAMDDAWRKVNSMKGKPQPNLGEDGEELSLGQGDQVQLPLIVGSDRNEGAIKATMANAERAGVDQFIQMKTCSIKANPWLNQPKVSSPEIDITAIQSQPPNDILIATNPPFGLRVSPSIKKKGKKTKKSSKGYGNIHPLLPLYQTIGNLVEGMNRSDGNIIDNDTDNNREVNVGILAHEIDLARKTGISDMKSLFTTRHGGISVTALGNCQMKENFVDR